MAYTLQVHGEKRVYPIPNGLYELMSDIAREVLRNQPCHIVSYIAEYLEALIKTKTLTKVALKEVDDVLCGEDPCVSLCISFGVSLDVANRAAAIIQAAFLGYLARKKMKKPSYEFAPVNPPTEITLDKFLEAHKISFLQATDAAIKIQASWRGFAVRKRLRREKEHATAPDQYTVESWNHDWLWKEFEITPDSEEALVFHKENLLPKRVFEKSKYLPRRNITIDHHKLKTLFRGEREDYEQLDNSDFSDRGSREMESWGEEQEAFVETPASKVQGDVYEEKDVKRKKPKTGGSGEGDTISQGGTQDEFAEEFRKSSSSVASIKGDALEDRIPEEHDKSSYLPETLSNPTFIPEEESSFQDTLGTVRTSYHMEGEGELDLTADSEDEAGNMAEFRPPVAPSTLMDETE
ncbi:uncharacterized protein LOC106663940 [Cimex lectularius]|uniref:RIIa domain-containing protein n=1 Tax=Cimex lectularius TaxID=79782 RepID=A0A8I6TES4_CIMLE|nr:uncharacterized protein LOC106663940 [Cimex lectularius]